MVVQVTVNFLFDNIYIGVNIRDVCFQVPELFVYDAVVADVFPATFLDQEHQQPECPGDNGCPCSVHRKTTSSWISSEVSPTSSVAPR